MNEETNMESGQTAQETGAPSSAPSTQPGVSATSAVPFTPEQESYIRSLFAREEQSVKDKRIGRIEKTLENYQPVLEKVSKLLTPQQMQEVQRELEMDELKARVFGQPSSVAQAPAAPMPAVDETAKIVAESLGLSTADPEVVSAVQSKRGTDLIREIANISARRKAAPTPTPASAAAPAGGSPTSMDAIYAEYANLSQNPSKNLARFKELQAIILKADV